MEKKPTKILRKATKIDKTHIKNAKDARKIYDAQIKPIEARINYIVMKIFELFEIKDHYWYLYGAAEGTRGDILNECNCTYIEPMYDSHKNNYKSGHIEDMNIYDRYNKHISLCDGFPTRWLWEDFEKELIDGKATYEAERLAQEAEANLVKKNADKTKKLVNKILAKKKLTKKEKIELGL